MDIGNFLKEANGNESSMRLAVMLVLVTLLGTWAYVSIATKAMAPLDWPTVGAIVGPLIAKAYQKKNEVQNANPPAA